MILENKMFQESLFLPSFSFSQFLPIFALNKTEIGYFPLLILSKKIFQRKKNNSRCLCSVVLQHSSDGSFLVFRDVLTIL